jgi:hypothetical protein
MATSKYRKYIVESPDIAKSKVHTNIVQQIGIINELNGALPGAFYLTCGLALNPVSIPESKPHNHDFDEYLIFLGTNPEDPHDLGGEIELWLEDEKHIITRSAAVFVPRGLYHTPLLFKRVDRPFITIRVGNSLKDTYLSYSQDPRWAHLPDDPTGA